MNVAERSRWLARLKKKEAERILRGGAHGLQLRQIRDRLLAVGGDAVVLPEQELDADVILKKGRVWEGRPRLVPMTASSCHHNVATMFDLGEAHCDGIVTGYGMTIDPETGLGVWRQHSWGLHGDKILETTEARDLYYGAELKDEDLDAFVDSNR